MNVVKNNLDPLKGAAETSWRRTVSISNPVYNIWVVALPEI